MLLEEYWILPKTGPIAIAKNIYIYTGNYQKEFVVMFFFVCFVFWRSTYGRFVDIFVETFNNGFSCFWILSVYWALPNVKKQLFLKKNIFLSIVAREIPKMFWIILEGTIKTLFISVNEKYLIQTISDYLMLQMLTHNGKKA